AQLKRARDALPGLRAGIGRLGLAVVGGTTPRPQIVEALETPVWARIPTDPRSAAFLRGEGGARRSGRRPLLAGARRLAQALTATAAREQAVSTPCAPPARRSSPRGPATLRPRRWAASPARTTHPTR